MSNPKTLTPGPRITYGPVHALPLSTPSTEHPQNIIKIIKKYVSVTGCLIDYSWRRNFERYVVQM